MDTIFEQDGIDFIRWTDDEGNIWTARYDEVELFGKECFEQWPRIEDHLGSWSVEFKDKELSELPDPTDEDYEYVDSWFEEGHEVKMNLDWI